MVYCFVIVWVWWLNWYLCCLVVVLFGGLFDDFGFGCGLLLVSCCNCLDCGFCWGGFGGLVGVDGGLICVEYFYL